MTSDARRIIQAAIQAVDPRTAVRAHFQLRPGCRSRILTVRGNANDDNSAQSYDLSSYDRILLVGFGKASAAMACAVVEELLSLHYTDASLAVDNAEDPHEEPLVFPPLEGMIICKDGHVSLQEREFLQQHNVVVQEASHPVPDERSVRASQRLLDLVQFSSSSKNTLLLACISGGGSALFCSPRPPLTLQHLQDTNTALLQSGWRIQDMNVLRQCLEVGKGGGLAQLATEGTTIVSLILSDIIGDPLDLIASGPTVVTPQSRQKFTTAWHLLQQDNTLRAQLPRAVLNVLRDGYEQERQQPQQFNNQLATKEKHQHHQHCLVGNNARAVQAAAQQAQALGYHPIVWTTQLQGEAATVAQVLVGLAQHVRHGPLPFNLVSAASHFPLALIAGGETTVTLPMAGSSLVVGKGGRNQELALAAALAMQNLQLRQVVVASIGTDGNDGPTDAAGAIVDGGTIQRLVRVVAEKEHDKLDNDYFNMSAEQALRQHNAYPFLDRCDREGVSPLVKVRMSGEFCFVLALIVRIRQRWIYSLN